MLAAHDLTEQQWRVLRTLTEAGPLEATELAERSFILAPSLTRMIKSLEERALITRARHEKDGRRVLLEITPGGRALIRKLKPESQAIFADLEAQFGKERMRKLLAQLDALADALS